jgi:hypothetical protein
MLIGGGRKRPFNLYRSADYTAGNLWGGYATAASIDPFFAGWLAVGINTPTLPSMPGSRRFHSTRRPRSSTIAPSIRGDGTTDTATVYV